MATRPPAGLEMMDDYSISDFRLHDALEALPKLNRWLGALRVVRSELREVLRVSPGRHLGLLDVGTGIGDIPIDLCRFARTLGRTVNVVALDANPQTIDYAREFWHRRLDSEDQSVTFQTADAFELPFPDNSFDYVMSSQFLHHFDHDDAVRILSEMNRAGRNGILVSDLHRSSVARAGISLLCFMTRMPQMIRHDAPLSVTRGFRRSELESICREAGLIDARIRWHFPFRWSVSTLRVQRGG